MSASAELMRISSARDLYYSDAANSLAQSIPVEYNTRFRQNFATLGAGQQNCFIPPNSGVKHVVLVLGFDPLANPAFAAQTGVNALPRGWGYRALQNTSWRVAGSSQFFLSGSQLLARNLRMCKTQSQRDAILSLAGDECKTAADFTSGPKYAYIPLSFWSAPSCDGLEVPIASDLLGQQIQVSATIASMDAIFTPNAAGGAPLNALPTAFNVGYFQIEQLEMMDRAMSMGNSRDLDTNTYIQAIRSFDQQELIGQLAAAAGEQQVTFSGFMSGQVKGLQVYLTDNTDPANTNTLIAPRDVTLTYAGAKYAEYRDGSSRIWNLIDGSSPSAVNQSQLVAAAGVWTSVPVLSEWAFLPFAQPIANDYEADLTVAGKMISNGSVTLTLVSPNPAKAYTVHVIPVLNAAIAYSRGSATVLIG
jgi:hypothetical protein